MPIVGLKSAIFRLLDACLTEELKERFEPRISRAARITAPEMHATAPRLRRRSGRDRTRDRLDASENILLIVSGTIIGTESHSNYTTKIVCIRKCFLQRCTRASDCWLEPMGSLTFVIYFCICRLAIQAFQRMNYCRVEPPTLDSRNNGLSVVGTESHSNSTTRIVCIRKYSCIRNHAFSVIGTEIH